MKNFIKESLEKQLNESVIRMDRLIKYAIGIQNVSHDYGDTFYHPKKKEIFVCLGDSNPFDDNTLKEFMLDSVTRYEDRDKVTITIEAESYPSGDGWQKFDGKKFVDYKN